MNAAWRNSKVQYPSGAKWKQLTIRFALFGMKHLYFRALHASTVREILIILMIRCFYALCDFHVECIRLSDRTADSEIDFFSLLCTRPNSLLWIWFARDFPTWRQLHFFPLFYFQRRKRFIFARDSRYPFITNSKAFFLWTSGAAKLTIFLHIAFLDTFFFMIGSVTCDEHRAYASHRIHSDHFAILIVW